MGKKVILPILLICLINCSKQEKHLNLTGTWKGVTDQEEKIKIEIEKINEKDIIKRIYLICTLTNDENIRVDLTIMDYGIQQVNENEFSFSCRKGISFFINGTFTDDKLKGEIRIQTEDDQYDVMAEYTGFYKAGKGNY